MNHQCEFDSDGDECKICHETVTEQLMEDFRRRQTPKTSENIITQDNTKPIIAWMTCPGCGSRWCPTFMVHDEIWEQSGLTGWPCILCFELAIGRRIKIEDLKTTPLCNHLLDMGWFLGTRTFGTLPTI